MPENIPDPDEFGRYRVVDTDTGHKFSIPASGLPHGHYRVLKEEPASDAAGDAVTPEHFAVKPTTKSPTESPVEPTSGQSADPKKEKAND